MKHENLYLEALNTRALYRAGEINREEAMERIQPYKELFNKISIEKARKYGVRPQKFSFTNFMR